MKGDWGLGQGRGCVGLVSEKGTYLNPKEGGGDALRQNILTISMGMNKGPQTSFHSLASRFSGEEGRGEG